MISSITCQCHQCSLREILRLLNLTVDNDSIRLITQYLPRYNIYGYLQSRGCSLINNESQIELIDISISKHIHRIPYLVYNKSYSKTKAYSRLNNFSDLIDNCDQIYPKQDALIIQTESNELFIARYHDNVLLSISPNYCWKLPLSTANKYQISEGIYESSVLIMDQETKEMYHLYMNIQAMDNDNNFCELDQSICPAPFNKMKKIISFKNRRQDWSMDAIYTHYIGLSCDGHVYQQTFADFMSSKQYSSELKKLSDLGIPLITDIACGRYDNLIFLVDNDKKLWKYDGTAKRFYKYDPFKRMNVKDIECGGEYALVLMENGLCFAFGCIDDIRFSQHDMTEHYLIQDLFSNNRTKRKVRFKMIGCGPKHCILLTKNNEFYGLGENENNQISVQETEFYMQPIKLSREQFGITNEKEDILRIIATKLHTFIVTSTPCNNVD